MIDVVLVLDSDSPENLRTINNSNLTMISNEINQILNYLDSDFGTLTGMSSIVTNELKVNSNKLVVNNSGSILNDTLQLNGDLKLSGNYINSNIYGTLVNNSLQEVINNAGEYNIGSSSSYPLYNVYQVSSVESGGLTVNLFPGMQGQELIIVMANDPGGVETYVKIRQGVTSTALLYLPSGKDFVVLSEIGATVSLRYVNDGWMILSSNQITFE